MGPSQHWTFLQIFSLGFPDLYLLASFQKWLKVAVWIFWGKLMFFKVGKWDIFESKNEMQKYKSFAKYVHYFSETLCDDWLSKGSKSDLFYYSEQLWLCPKKPLDFFWYKIDTFHISYFINLFLPRTRS